MKFTLTLTIERNEPKPTPIAKQQPPLVPPAIPAAPDPTLEHPIRDFTDGNYL